MSLRILVVDFLRRMAMEAGHLSTVDGVRLSDPHHNEYSRERIELMQSALELLRSHGPHIHRRLVKYVRWIVMLPAEPEYWSRQKAIVLPSHYDLSDQVLASLLAHETVHAWIDHLGIRVGVEDRLRAETLCLTAQARVLESIGFSDEVVSKVYSSLEHAWWEDDRLRDRRIRDAVGIGIPLALARLLDRIFSGRRKRRG